MASNKSVNLLDETIDDFQENLKLIKENKLKLTNIGKYLIRQSNNVSTDNSVTSIDSFNANITRKEVGKKINDETSKLSLFNLNKSTPKPYKNSNNKLGRSKSEKCGISKYFTNLNSKDDEIKESIENIEKFNCPLCDENLSKFTENERMLHVNKCLEKFQKTKPNSVEEETEKSSSSAKIEDKKKINDIEDNERDKKFVEDVLRDGVPNCPICGKILLTSNSRQSHLKKCANEFHIKPDSLVELIKRQQLKITQSLEKGFIPNDIYLPKNKNSKNKKAKQLSKILKMEQPKNEQEEELQMAIALSNSISKDEKNVFKLVKTTKNNQNHNNDLLLYDNDDRRRIIADRLTQILENTINLNVLITKPMLNDLVKTKFSNQNNYLWNKCKYFTDQNDSFYVKNFVNFACFSVGGQLFANKQNEFSNIEVINTQTAFLLADLNNTTQLEVTQQQTNTMHEIELVENDDSIVFIENNSDEYSRPKTQDMSKTNNKFVQLFEETIVENEQEGDYKNACVILEETIFNDDKVDECHNNDVDIDVLSISSNESQKSFNKENKRKRNSDNNKDNDDDEDIIECKVIKLDKSDQCGIEQLYENQSSNEELPKINQESPKHCDNFDQIWNNFDDNQFDNYIQYDNDSFNNSKTEPSNLSQIMSLEDSVSQKEVTNTRSTIYSESFKVIDEQKKDFKSPFTPKTVIVAKKSKNDNAISSPLTPMPDYLAMNTPILKNELKTFGLKVLPRKHAVKKLVEIYEYTHKSKLSLIKSKSCPSIHTLISNDKSCEKSGNTNNEKQQSPIIKPKKARMKKTLSQSENINKPMQIDQMSSQATQNESDNGNLDQFEINEADVEIMTNLNEDELKQKIYKFILNNTELHLKVLNYEPLEFDKLFAQVKQLFKINNKLLMKILDEFCITFTLKNIKSRVSKLKSRKKN